MAHFIAKPQLNDCRCAVSAADDGNGITLRHSLGHSNGTGREVTHLGYTHGAVPDNSLGACNGIGKFLLRSGSYIQANVALGDFIGINGDNMGIVASKTVIREIEKMGKANTNDGNMMALIKKVQADVDKAVTAIKNDFEL